MDVRPNDWELGMDRSIARRNFLNGVAAVSLRSMLRVRWGPESPWQQRDNRRSLSTTTHRNAWKPAGVFQS
jgi:hypothetical protein